MGSCRNICKEFLQVPTKCVASTQNFAVKCGVQFIDFEGRTDGKQVCSNLRSGLYLYFFRRVYIQVAATVETQEGNPSEGKPAKSQQSERFLQWGEQEKIVGSRIVPFLFSRISLLMVVSGVNVRESRLGWTRNLRDFRVPEVEDYSHISIPHIWLVKDCDGLECKLPTPQVVEGENNIFVPKNGEWVDATTERFIYQVSLT